MQPIRYQWRRQRNVSANSGSLSSSGKWTCGYGRDSSVPVEWTSDWFPLRNTTPFFFYDTSQHNTALCEIARCFVFSTTAFSTTVPHKNGFNMLQRYHNLKPSTLSCNASLEMSSASFLIGTHLIKTIPIVYNTLPTARATREKTG